MTSESELDRRVKKQEKSINEIRKKLQILEEEQRNLKKELLIRQKQDQINTKSDNSNQNFPTPLEDEKILRKKYASQYIAIYQNQIIAVDPNLQELHKKITILLPNGEGCRIKYIEDGAFIYGISI